MRILQGDSVIIGSGKRAVGIVERRSGNQLVVRRPDAGNQREHVGRNEVSSLAEFMYTARKNETRFRNGLSLVGDSTLAELVEAFGYSVGQMPDHRGAAGDVLAGSHGAS
ncbi:hypothetical protein [Archangium lansingense]|uniref:Uncharacterized protein n=1 Tax=Archangium lansingense TaxID=2995310 RepID=A0ABT4ADD7_9BACT|nr:hypothetical protein [Archangium lansinium]MCY1079688.1 hypothetical protein [Archangium lansinium]